MKNKQSKTPLLKTCLIQLIFSPLYGIEEFIPQIQKELRKTGFLETRNNENKTVSFNKSIDNPVITEDKNWFFISLKNQEIVSINKTQFSLQTDNYTNFETFIERYKSLLEKFFPIIDSSTITIKQLGLRYINVLRGQKWKEILKDSYHGVSIADEYRDQGKPWMIASTAQGMTTIDNSGNTGLLNIRIYQNNKGNETPLDIFYPTPQISEDEKLITFFDIDHILRFDTEKEIKAEELIKFGRKLNTLSSKIYFDALNKDAKADL